MIGNKPNVPQGLIIKIMVHPHLGSPFSISDVSFDVEGAHKTIAILLVLFSCFPGKGGMIL